MHTKHDLLIVTDLDGSLLDEDTYSFESAKESLSQITSLGIPLVLNTSKTIKELETLRRDLQNDHPFIVENGTGVVIPKDYFEVLDETLSTTNGYLLKTFGAELGTIIPLIEALRNELGVSFRGFSEMSVHEIVALTHLTYENAQRAKTRNFSEPIVWQDSDEAWRLFSSKLTGSGIKRHQGDRFVHLSGGGDKGQAGEWLRRCYVSNGHPALKVVALGNSANDIPMLLTADIPVIIRTSGRTLSAIPGRGDTIVTDEFGPAGWNNAILKILREFC